MCGIAAIIGTSATSGHAEAQVSRMLSKIRHRGDQEHAGELASIQHAALGCNRLAIVDQQHGRQPIISADRSILVVHNGEIYNHQELRRLLSMKGHQFITECDTEVLVHAYREWGKDMVEHLDGMFAFVLYDAAQHTFLAARDHIGIKPLYYLRQDDTYYFASEMKCLLEFSHDIQVVPPGHVMQRGELHQYFTLTKELVETDDPSAVLRFKHLFVDAVRKMVQTDLPIGVIFSGGLDSAAVLRIATQYHSNVTAFTIGFEGASDMEIAKRYCAEYGIKHEIKYLDINELIDNLPAIVFGCETFETIDIMDASIMYFSYKLAHSAGMKVVLVGDGSDEVLAGYDFFKTHPDPDYLMTYRLGNLYRTDLQRIDRCSMMSRVEARPPFLDQAFLRFAYSLPIDLKLRDSTEKWILREAFVDELPDYMRLRRKVRMPEGSGLRNQLLDFARLQQSHVDPAILSMLAIDTPDGAYFLEQYLKAGFPLPKARYKRAGLDFAAHGYFDFSPESAQPLLVSHQE
jgi:asparagine synthase (glutamine-hydrolysing)